MKNKQILIASIVFPVLVLFAVAMNHALHKKNGGEVTLKITGYDPRDLLSGHYITYQVDYELHRPSSLCNSKDSNQGYSQENEKGFICFSGQRNFTYSELKECDLYLQGHCSSNTFRAGIERFYIPEQYAKDLDLVVRDGRGKIVVSISKNGKGIVKDLLIDDVPFKEWVKRTKNNMNEL